VAVPSPPRRARPGVWIGPFGVFSLLFGGIWALVGWTVTITFAAIGGGPWNDWILDRRGVPAQARPIQVIETGTRVNRRRVYQVVFRYIDQAGHGQRATARTVDLGLVEKARQGEPLPVQYDPEAPERVRFEGRRASAFGLGAFFPLVFGLVGTVIMAFGVRGMARRFRLLSHGQLSRGRVTEVKPTGTYVNRRQLMAVTYEFWSSAGQIRATERHLSPPSPGTDVSVVYDPASPGRSMLVEPGAFR
jgi:hypothetical protein